MEQILFPVDFSVPCEAAASTVAAVARVMGARVALLHVVRPPFFPTELTPLQSHFRTVWEEMEGALGSYLSEVWNGIETEAILRGGDPAGEIVGYTKQQEVDMVMMPTRGHTRFRQLLLGSVTAAVLHDAECPVWTSAHAEDDGAGVREVRSILCAVDLREGSLGVLRMAGWFAALFGADLHVVHVAPTEEEADEALERYARLAGVSDLRVASDFDALEDRSVVDAILSAEEDRKADWLVIGRGKMQGALGRLRTNAHQLIRMSRCPVLSV